MSMPEQLKPYIHLVDFLADFLGKDTEVVLHDLTDWHNSVVAIRNGHISGRKVGAPITDFALEIIRNGDYKDKPYKVNYKGATRGGGQVRSATYFIRDENDNQLIGMLCINSDCAKFIEMRDYLNNYLKLEDQPETPEPVTENLSADVGDLVRNNMAQILEAGRDPKSLSKQDKIDLVDRLEELGTFMVKGSVWYVAEELGVSVSTVYRYLTITKKNNHRRSEREPS